MIKWAIISAGMALGLILLYELGRVGNRPVSTDGLWRTIADSPRAEREEAVPPILAAGEAIRSLHKRIRPPKPDEWLATHHEPGQTFEAYRHSSPNRPGGARTTLYIQPLGTPSRDQRVLITDTAELLRRFYGLPVKTQEPIDLADLLA